MDGILLQQKLSHRVQKKNHNISQAFVVVLNWIQLFSRWNIVFVFYLFFFAFNKNWFATFDLYYSWDTLHKHWISNSWHVLIDFCFHHFTVCRNRTQLKSILSKQLADSQCLLWHFFYVYSLRKYTGRHRYGYLDKTRQFLLTFFAMVIFLV